MKKKTSFDIDKADNLLETLKKLPDENGMLELKVKSFEVGNLNKPIDREHYFSYSGAIVIAQDYSNIKRNEAFGIWESNDNNTGRLWAIAYRGEIFLREGKEDGS